MYNYHAINGLQMLTGGVENEFYLRSVGYMAATHAQCAHGWPHPLFFESMTQLITFNQ